MPFAATLSRSADTENAILNVCRDSLKKLDGQPDLAILFFSPDHAGALESKAKHLRLMLGGCVLIGVQGESIVGNDEEVEQSAAMCLWLARWAGTVSMDSFHLELTQTPEGRAILGWPDGLSDARASDSSLILVADPFSFPIDACLKRMNTEHAGLPVVGGMASGAHGPGPRRMIYNGRVVGQGAVGVLLRGNARLRTVISQGCRPIGTPMVVTGAHDNIITGLGGKRPLDQLRALWQNLNSADRTLAQEGLHIGQVINEYQREFGRGDFLVRNVMGIDEETGALAMTDSIRIGLTVQFQIRDAQTAHDDLAELLGRHKKSQSGRAAGGLLFTCNGRGTRLFQEPGHDARLIREMVGDCPLAGFFAQGELGPIGRQNFIHGFTASLALFEE